MAVCAELTTGTQHTVPNLGLGPSMGRMRLASAICEGSGGHHCRPNSGRAAGSEGEVKRRVPRERVRLEFEERVGAHLQAAEAEQGGPDSWAPLWAWR